MEKILERSTCFHCGLETDPPHLVKGDIQDIERGFCCSGCRSVCSTIFDAGLEGFYNRVNKDYSSPPPEPPKDPEVYDLSDIQEEFLQKRGDEFETKLLVEGIHCAACIWLIEQVMGRTDGVRFAEVNFTNKSLTVRWDNEKIRLSQIIKRLRQVGYSAIPYLPNLAEEVFSRSRRMSLYRIGFAGFSAMNLMWISIALWTGASEGEYRDFLRWAGFFLATPTLFFSGYPFFRSAVIGLRRLHLTMDLPIALGALITYGYSVYVTLLQSSSSEVYFDTVVAFIFVILIGRYLESSAVGRSIHSTQRLFELQPKVVTVLRDSVEQKISIRSVKPGDWVLVKPGERISVDGVVVEGGSSVDESMLTGESVPISKSTGDLVSAGTLNSLGRLTIRTERTSKETSLAKIASLMEKAMVSKAPIQRFADRIVPWFVLGTLTVAAVTFLYWVGLDMEFAILAATSVLIITCPCALGLATPTAIISATGRGAKEGILIKNGGALELLGRANHFVFDKTGSLTEGKAKVRSVRSLNGMSEKNLLQLAASLERYSEHPFAKAIVSAIDETEIGNGRRVDRFEAIPGLGVRGTIGGNRYSIGSMKLLESEKIVLREEVQKEITQSEKEGFSPVFCLLNDRVVGYIVVGDALRKDAEVTVESLNREGKKLTLLTGDRQSVADQIGQKLVGMDVLGEMSPEEKIRAVEKIMGQGDTTVMVGDGINDAPSLIQADVGIAVGSGTDVALESADVIILGEKIYKVKEAYDLARRTLRTIKQNLTMSIIYNVIMVPLAFLGFITPVLAAIAMPISSLLVIGNAARLQKGK